MAAKKVFRIKNEHIKEIPVVSNYYIEKAFSEGYVFIKETENNTENEIRMINTTTTKKQFTVTLVEAEIVG